MSRTVDLPTPRALVEGSTGTWKAPTPPTDNAATDAKTRADTISALYHTQARAAASTLLLPTALLLGAPWRDLFYHIASKSVQIGSKTEPPAEVVLGVRFSEEVRREGWGGALNFSRVMNRYTLTKKLGDGTYGSVVKAVNRQTGEEVAVKKMKKLFTRCVCVYF